MANGFSEQVWSIEQVVALAHTSARFGAGEGLAVPSLWSHTGASERAVWGCYHGSGSEPYEIAVDHVNVRDRCTCPSRARPCKHVVGLLVMWVRGFVVDVAEPPPITSWIDRELRRLAPASDGESTADDSSDHHGDAPSAGGHRPDDSSRPEPADPPEEAGPGDVPDSSRNDRIKRLMGGLVELDRWLEDRLRAGLSDPSIARFSTWDELANRLVDARAGALANRVRRLAGRVGTTPDWHEHVLAEMGILHLIAQAGQRVPALPTELGDAVAVTCGWQARKADVEGSAPETDRWFVAGRSDTREDLVEVRRVWLRGLDRGSWAMVLSFAAYRQSLDTSLMVGSVIHADVHRYPGSGQRSLVGQIHGTESGPACAIAPASTTAVTVEGAYAEVGRMFAIEPWLDRVPVTITASPTLGDGSWVLTDHTGSLMIAPDASARSDTLGALLAASAGAPVTLTVEWTAAGVVPLAVFLDDRTIDIGRRAEASFVSSRRGAA